MQRIYESLTVLTTPHGTRSRTFFFSLVHDFFSLLLDSYLNSSVPTVVLGRRGVNRKWFRGDTTLTSNLDLSRSLATRKPPHPTPRTTTRGFEKDTEEWESLDSTGQDRLPLPGLRQVDADSITLATERSTRKGTGPNSKLRTEQNRRHGGRTRKQFFLCY